MVSAHREEVLNVVLALLLHRRGIVAAPEQILTRTLEQGRAMPDVLVHYQGLRTAIEGRTVVSPGARRALLNKARDRVRQGIAHLGIAIIYPQPLRMTPFERLEDELGRAIMNFAVVSEAEDIQLPLQLGDVPESDDLTMPAVWAQGDVGNLSDLLRRTYERLVQEDVVKRAAESIQAGIIQFSQIILESSGSIERSASALGIKVLPTNEAEDQENLP